MTSIPARYDGRCPKCGRTWAPGDSISPAPSGGFARWGHTVCPDDPDDPTLLRRGESVCPDCYLVHPEGTCGQ